MQDDPCPIHSQRPGSWPFIPMVWTRMLGMNRSTISNGVKRGSHYPAVTCETPAGRHFYGFSSESIMSFYGRHYHRRTYRKRWAIEQYVSKALEQRSYIMSEKYLEEVPLRGASQVRSQQFRIEAAAGCRAAKGKQQCPTMISRATP